MNVLTLFCIVFLCVISIFLFNQSNVIYKKMPIVILAFILGFSALLWMIFLYGALRGAFIYLGVLSLSGMFYTLIRYKLVKQ